MNMTLSKAIYTGNSLKTRYMTYLIAIIVNASYIKQMCLYILLVTNIIMLFRTPAPLGVGGVFLCRAQPIRNKWMFFALKKIFLSDGTTAAPERAVCFADLYRR
jgi:hypothetical protein